ncbi:hypothetical protein EZBTHKR_2256 [Elizabethkingia anophelis]|uniref:Uncharacterized protein n=1 Tax=Elizabethkingia anophelis TaxID=1117645 RepID=A0A455ZFF4_9FLAO|nr:hypothetical protein EZBTHKR_2256 [Elizabethkingia anophelis]DAC75490.1 TPA_exp: hypothetical protein [Elizabethkingia anophelis]
MNNKTVSAKEIILKNPIVKVNDSNPSIPKTVKIIGRINEIQ